VVDDVPELLADVQQKGLDLLRGEILLEEPRQEVVEELEERLLEIAEGVGERPRLLVAERLTADTSASLRASLARTSMSAKSGCLTASVEKLAPPAGPRAVEWMQTNIHARSAGRSGRPPPRRPRSEGAPRARRNASLRPPRLPSAA
jgi:hypothetical protein